MAEGTYDSTGDTLKHSLRVGALMVQVINELSQRSVQHDLSKTEPPELEVFNKVTPRLSTLTYGSEEYKASLKEMGPALDHHYANNRHHPEWHPRGVNGMTLVDVIEMIADWKASSERSPNGDLAKSLATQRDRFGIEPQLLDILVNTAHHFGWIPEPNIYEQTERHDGLRKHLYAVHHNLAALGLSDAEALRQHRDYHAEEPWRHEPADLSWTDEEMAEARRDDEAGGSGDA